MTATTELKTYGLYIGGEETRAESGATFDSINPTSGRVWATHALAGIEDVDRTVRAAREAFSGEAWRGLSPTRRGRLMTRLAELIA
jgi:(Z)-2-((N-methylformamido)methylene)-5-hydroxybutyrolactone dehydrogenase